MATRRTAEGPSFDHGAQYFTVRDERFERYVQVVDPGWNRRPVGSPHAALLTGRTYSRTLTTATKTTSPVRSASLG